MTWDFDAQPKELVGECNLCGGHGFKASATKDRYGHKVWLSECGGCGLKFLNPRMTQEAYAEFYRDGHYRELLSEFFGKPVTAESIEPEQEQYAVKIERLLRPFVKARKLGSFLDVGGSTGVVADFLANRWHLDRSDAWIIEPSMSEYTRALDRDVETWLGSAADVGCLPRTFDLVLLCQTVDHLLDIARTLRHIRSKLSDHGLLFVDFVRNGPIKIDHPYYLTEETMADYLRRNGFRVIGQRPDTDGLHYDMIAERA